MSEVIVSTKNTFLTTSESRRLLFKRSFSDNHLDSILEDGMSYSVTMNYSILTDISHDAASKMQERRDSNPSVSEVVIESYATGQSMAVSIKGEADASPLGCESIQSTTGSFSDDLSMTESPRSSSLGSPDSKASILFDDRTSSPARSKQEKKNFLPCIRDVAAENPVEHKTTIMIRNIPCRYSQEELCEEITRTRLPFNFLYLPPSRHNSNSHSNLGYAFVNFTKSRHAAQFLKIWDQHVWFFQPKSKKRGVMSYATLQGFQANKDYYTQAKISKTKLRPIIRTNRQRYRGTSQQVSR
jgi:hypothetical protein